MNHTLECICNSFAEIESKDIRVDKVILEKDKYYELITSRDFLVSGVNNPVLMSTSDIESGRLGTLWGAKLEIGEKSKVCGERGVPPFNKRKYIYNYDPGAQEDTYVYRFDPNRYLRYEIDIDWPLSPEAMRRNIRRNLTIIVKSRSELSYRYPKSEWRAIETLREMITEKEWRNYIKYGFLLVKGSSGKTYQIPRNKDHTKVWQNGRVIEEICVRIKDNNIPPTDNVIAFKVLIESDEESFKKLGNVYKNAA